MPKKPYVDDVISGILDSTDKDVFNKLPSCSARRWAGGRALRMTFLRWAYCTTNMHSNRAFLMLTHIAQDAWGALIKQVQSIGAASAAGNRFLMPRHIMLHTYLSTSMNTRAVAQHKQVLKHVLLSITELLAFVSVLHFRTIQITVVNAALNHILVSVCMPCSS
jgi:hypothetical protein